ncbi:hypothetical protein [Peptacetobacter sp.]|uniref:hypothetical protein n=1 Tax=Peptacetobacter sp. TaxID=2991975 RepID=UPI00262F0BA2|nr:hypothetical protein [Peptacetobacter sp.]
MSVNSIKRILTKLLINHSIVGADICGEQNINEPLPKFLKDRELNKKTNKLLYDFLTEIL